MSSAPILIFDSGVGGLSIHAAIAARLPHENYIYACDNAAFPYGGKAEDELVQRVHDVLDALIARYQPKILVIGCNTASTVALPRLRQHYALPIVGVVPAIKPAALISHNKIIGLLATPGTVRRAYTDKLIADFAADCTVLRIGSSELVLLAEKKLRGEEINIDVLRELLSPFFKANTTVDTIVLGCTHFPLLRAELQQAAPQPVNWIDSGNAIADRVMSLLAAIPDQNTDSKKATAVFTRKDNDAEALSGALQKRGFAQIEFIEV